MKGLNVLGVSCLLVLMLSCVSTVVPVDLQPVTSPTIFDAPDDTIIWETVQEPYSLDPHLEYYSYGQWIFYNVYETLYTYPWDSNNSEPTVPLLAASPPSLSVDGLNYTISLRENVTFHDGTPFNASCVQWNIYRAAKIFYLAGPFWMIAESLLGGAYLESVAYDYDPSSSEYAQAFDDWVAMEPVQVLNPFTIRFRLEEPYVPFISALTHSVGAMMSPTYALKHADTGFTDWEDYGVDYGQWGTYMFDHMCGTGPYTLQEWMPGQYIHLIEFTNYWRSSSSPGAGSINQVFIRTNEDFNARRLNLEEKTIDGCYWPTSSADLIWDSESQTSLNPNITVSTGGCSFAIYSGGYNVGLFNTTDGTMISSPYQNPDFRKACCYLFDYDAYISGVSYGFAVPARGPIPLGMWGHNSTAYQYTLNYTVAVEQWNEAIKDVNFVNSLHSMDDTMTFFYNYGSTWKEQMCLLLAVGLEQVFADPSADMSDFPSGITINIQGLEWANYLIYRRDRKLLMGFDAWAADFADPSNFLSAFAYSLGAFPHINGYSNPSIDVWYELQLGEYDPGLRQYYLSAIQEEMNEDCPYLWAQQPTEFRTWGAWLEGDGLIYNPMHDIYFYHVVKTLFADDDVSPTIDSPPDQLIVFSDGLEITWHPFDENPYYYSILLNGTPYTDGPWNGSAITFTRSGEHTYDWIGFTVNFTLLVYDAAIQSASDSVLVEVVAESTTTTTTSTTSTSTTTTTTTTTTSTGSTSTTTTTTTTDMDLGPLLTIVVPLAAGFAVTMVVGLFYLRRKGPG